MKVQQTLAQTWKRRRDSDHADLKRLIEERGVGLLRVPDELLDIILGYSDLRTRFAATTISHQFCDSIARLSPRLEYQLVRKKFPLLATALDADRSHAPAEPRELYRMYSRFFDGAEDEAVPETVPTTALDDYTLTAELELVTVHPNEPRIRPKESLFVGLGTVVETNSATYEFAVPRRVFTNVDDRFEAGLPYSVRVKIVATRRAGGISGRLQHAKLYEGQPDDGELDLMYFESHYIRMARGNFLAPSTAFRWLGGVTDWDAILDVRWTRDVAEGTERHALGRRDAPSTIRAQFRWSTPDDIVDMSLADACMTLEHWVDWRG